jgi:integrase
MISKKLPHRKVECDYCLTEMRFDSLCVHKAKSCVIYKMFGRTKKEIDAALKGVYSEELIRLQSRIKDLEEENTKLHEILQEVEKQNTDLKQSNLELSKIVNQNYYDKNSQVPYQGLEINQINQPDSIQTPVQNKFPLSKSNIERVITQSHVAESTKVEYRSVWNKYETWCSENSLNPLLSTSANSFVSHELSQNPSLTVKRNRGVIQSIVRRLIPNFTLQKIRTKIHFKRDKHFLSKQQLNDYLLYVKENHPHTFLPQYLQSELGLRINSVANFKKKNFFFANDPEDHRVEIEDSKIKLRDPVVKEVNPDVVEVTKEFLENNEIKNDFLFSSHKNESSKRARLLGRKVNRTLKLYAKKNPGFPNITSHGLRRTFAEHRKSDKIYDAVLKEVAKEIGHSNPNTTKNFYLSDKTHVPDLDHIIKVGVHQHVSEKSKSNLLSKADLHFYNFQQSELTCNSKESLLNALKEKNIEFSDDLIFYQNGKDIQELKPADVEVYYEFKRQSRLGFYAPVKLVQDPVQGWIVKATGFIKRFTLLCEYSGEVVDESKDSEVIRSEAIMEYLTSDANSLVIFPDKFGNLARFISGVNNQKGKHNQNVKSMKAKIDGGIHILLYTMRNIHPGETLYYDYNQGGLNEKDTSNFVTEKKVKKRKSDK